jgi:hypothetical protein
MFDCFLLVAYKIENKTKSKPCIFNKIEIRYVNIDYLFKWIRYHWKKIRLREKFWIIKFNKTIYIINFLYFDDFHHISSLLIIDKHEILYSLLHFLIIFYSCLALFVISFNIDNKNKNIIIVLFLYELNYSAYFFNFILFVD